MINNFSNCRKHCAFVLKGAMIHICTYYKYDRIEDKYILVFFSQINFSYSRCKFCLNSLHAEKRSSTCT